MGIQKITAFWGVKKDPLFLGPKNDPFFGGVKICWFFSMVIRRSMQHVLVRSFLESSSSVFIIFFMSYYLTVGSFAK